MLTDDNWKEMLLEAKIEALDGSPRATSGKPFSIRKVSCKNDSFAAKVEPQGRSDSFSLRVKLTQPIAETFTQTWVTIEADLSEDAVLEIPVSIARLR